MSNDRGLFTGCVMKTWTVRAEPTEVADQLGFRLYNSGNLVVLSGRKRNHIVGTVFVGPTELSVLQIEAKHHSIIRQATNLFGRPIA